MAGKALKISITDHSREAAGMTYCYPVLSRRAGGVSIGINLNTNNACNWRCIYCQVPNLRRGAAPAVDLALLRAELEALIDRVRAGGLREHDDTPVTRIADIALSGNGEPTSAREFPEVVIIAAEVAASRALSQSTPIRVITNGSLMHRQTVRRGLDGLSRAGGEAWFKLDAGTSEGMRRINGVALTPEKVLRNLRACASRCRTWVQTCLFRLDGLGPSDAEFSAYLDLLKRGAGPGLAGVMLYGIARASQQPEAARLSRLEPGELEAFAERIRRIGLEASVSP